MDQNRDWKPIAALVLAGLALFVALGGSRGYGSDQVSPVPQQIIIQPAAPSTGTTGGTTAPVTVAPGPQQIDATHAWRGWRGGWPIFPFFPLFLLGFIFLAFWIFKRGRFGWGGPGWYGRPWGGPGPGPQSPPGGQPYGQYPPQYSQGQPYGGYPHGQQPQQSQQGQQPTQAPDAHGDITRPEGSGD
jgi:hypothetical protein